MKNFLSFSLIFIVVCTSFAQTGWNWQNPYLQGNELNAIDMNGSVGWAVGSLGTVIHTTNSGHDWELVEIGTSETLNDIYIEIITGKGWIVGNNGTIYHTHDSGENWTRQNSGTTEPLYSVTSIEGECVWVCGNESILHTYDDGETWFKVNSIFNLRFLEIDQVDCNEIWITGEDGLIINTTDAGDTWTSHATPTSRDLYSIDVVQYGDYRACGRAGFIIGSYDEGNSWITETQLGESSNLNNVVTKGIYGTSYAVGNGGKILESLNHGETWTQMDSITFCELNDVTISNGIYVVGQYGIVIRKEDEIDAEFEIMNKRSMLDIKSIEFVNENMGWAVGGKTDFYPFYSAGVILHTTDGGENWEEQLSLTSDLSDVDFVDQNSGWAVGRDGIIRHTANGGLNWGTQNSPLDGRLESVCFIDENNGWVVSSSNWGEIIHTTNGGNTWIEQSNPTSNPLYDVFFINENKGWAVGLDSTIIQTTDGGENWEKVITNAANGYRFASVFFLDEMRGWVSGIYGSMMLTEDGGNSWQEVESGTNELLNSVFFIDSNNGWAVGNQGTILRSLDGGHHWFSQQSGVDINILNSVHFTDPSNGWVSGEGGTILHTANGGFSHPYGTFGVHGLGLPINDEEQIQSDIIVNIEDLLREEYYLIGVELFIDTILHPRVSDLEIKLSHLDVTATLVYHVTDQGANILWTKLTDEATLMITDGTAPFSGDHKPYEALSAFYGLDPNGEWTLTIYDSEGGHEGTLNAWGIKPLFNKVISIEENEMIKEPQKIQLSQNNPNPFTGRTNISWDSQISGHTLLKVFNISGQEISTLLNKPLPLGKHSIEFDGSQLSKGVYYYQLTVGDFSSTKKCILL